MHLLGGCLCGGLRYLVSGPPIDAGFCHCRMCQRATGAPTVAWGTVPVAAFRYSKGSPAIYPSSMRYQREFCAMCGTSIVFRGQRAPRFVDFTLASLDTPTAIEPEYHIWRMSRIPWFETTDNLPRHADAGPDQP
ncbi:MAG: GFA family protein [Gammaproteobacteria bacterium]|nr:GFA family protein [Gammaproteobacteria bacterium]